MRTLIISDIHSNIHALETIWRQERDCDQVYCAGDLVDYGPYPKDVVNWIREKEIPCVQGNHDAWVALCYRRRQTLAIMPPEESAWVHHNAELLSDDDIAFLEGLPKALSFELNGCLYGMIHLFHEYDEIVSLHAFQNFCAQSFGLPSLENLIIGHTHRQAIRYLSNTVKWLNPGSASYRRKDDPDQSAHYATITDDIIALHRLDYDLQPVHQAACQVNLKESEMKVAEHIFGPRISGDAPKSSANKIP